MKTINIFLVFLLCFYAGFSFAQETRLKYIGVESGVTFISSEMSDIDFVRGEIPSYYGGYKTNTLTSLSNKVYLGIKSEIYSLNSKFGFMGGIRYTRLNNSVGKNNYWTSNTNYFYWMYHQDGVNTEYIKVKEITQISDYVGIPLEVRFSPARKNRLIRVYFKLGAEISYLAHSKTGVVFYNTDMNQYESDLTASIEKPKKISSSLYGGGGLRIGRNPKPTFSLEACLLNVYLTPRSSGLVYPMVGGGFQLNFQIPIKTQVQ
jgi:hypothetical protein